MNRGETSCVSTCGAEQVSLPLPKREDFFMLNFNPSCDLLVEEVKKRPVRRNNFQKKLRMAERGGRRNLAGTIFAGSPGRQKIELQRSPPPPLVPVCGTDVLYSTHSSMGSLSSLFLVLPPSLIDFGSRVCSLFARAKRTEFAATQERKRKEGRKRYKFANSIPFLYFGR